jgi:hypothetical protein
MGGVGKSLVIMLAMLPSLLFGTCVALSLSVAAEDFLVVIVIRRISCTRQQSDYAKQESATLASD